MTATNVYWSEPNGIRTVPIAGGSPETYATIEQPVSIAIDGTSLYHTGVKHGVSELEGVWSVNLDGSSPSTLDSWTDPIGANSLRSDGTALYWVETRSGTLKKMPLVGGPTETLASHLASPDGLAIDATSAYMVTYDGIVKITPK